MRRSSVTVILPITILLAGLALTAALVMSARSDAASTARETALGNRAYVAAVSASAEGRLEALTDRLHTAANSIAVAPEQERSAQIAAADLLDAASMVTAVCIPRPALWQCETFNGPVEHNRIDRLEPGLQPIESGALSGMLAYAASTPETDSISAILIIDPALIDVSIKRGLPLQVGLFGLPGGDAAEPLRATANDVGGGMSIDETTGQIIVSRSRVLLSENVTLRTIAGPDQLVLEPEQSTTLLLVGGIGLTLSLTGLAAFGTRSLSRIIDERDEADAARAQAAQRFRTSFTNAPIGVVEVDEEGRVVAVNPRFASQLGYNVDELDGMVLIDLVDGEDRAAARTRLQRLFESESVADQSERRYRDRNGGAVWVRESASVLELGPDRRHVLIQAEDVSDERRNRAELHRKALFDDLTGLPNRANLTARLNRAMEIERGGDEVLAVMFVDLDKFKEVNDTHGHEAGDRLLIEVAERLRRVSRSTDTVARLGGDEFVVICEGLENETDAEACAKRFADALSRPMVIDDHEVAVQASIGLVITTGESNPENVLRQADQAMYQAKTTGRNRLVRFEGASEDRRPSTAPSTECTEADLRDALESDRFVVHYQPVFDSTDTERVVGVEALVRFDHPHRGIVMPSDFLRAAEKYHLVGQIDELVVATGLNDLQQWIDADDAAADWFVSFNLANSNFHERAFAERLLGVINDHGIEPDQLILERTEIGFMHQPPTAVLVTRALREARVRIAIDHFGTGAVSLSEVPTMEFDLLKIDRSFVRNPSFRQQSLLNAIAEMAEALDLSALVEGIETADELSSVRGAKIPLAQGFHLGRPLDGQAIAMQFLQSHTTVS